MKIGRLSIFFLQVSQARVEFEDELRKQLRRQAAAHSEHLEDVLRAQREQLSVQAKRNVEEAILHEREIFTRQLASSVARLQAIEVALEGTVNELNKFRIVSEIVSFDPQVEPIWTTPIDELKTYG